MVHIDNILALVQIMAVAADQANKLSYQTVGALNMNAIFPCINVALHKSMDECKKDVTPVH